MLPLDKIALFIDGANLHATCRALGFDVDYKRLLKEFQSRGTLLRAFYFTTIIEDQEYSSVRPLIDWLDYNGYTVVTKLTKEFIDAGGRRKAKGSMNIELAVNAMALAGHIDQMFLFSGDGDFRPLLEAMQRRGVHVTVVSTNASQPPMVADELRRRQADLFVDLVELKPKLGRDRRCGRDHARYASDRPNSRRAGRSMEMTSRNDFSTLTGRRRKPQHELEPRQIVAHLDPCAVKAGDGGHKAEPETVSRRVAALLEPVEALEDMLMLVGGNSRPVIGDRDHRPAVDDLVRHHDMPSGAAVLDRIVDEIGDRIEDQIAIARHQHFALANDGETGAVRFGRGIVQLDDLAGDFDQVHGAECALALPGLDLRNPRQ